MGFFSVLMNMLTDSYDVPWESPFLLELTEREAFGDKYTCDYSRRS